MIEQYPLTMEQLKNDMTWQQAVANYKACANANATAHFILVARV